MNKEQIVALLKTKKVTVGLASAFSALAGAAVGYAVAQKRLEKAYEEIVKNEVNAAKQFYGALYKTDEQYASPEAVAEARLSNEALSALRKYTAGESDESIVESITDVEDGLEVVVTTIERKEVVRNVFTDSNIDVDDEFDYATEVAMRDSSKPYIISHDEFFENTPQFNQVNVTYYEGDDVLADQTDQVIDDLEGTVSSDNLKFGHGSKDANIVYVRNEPLELDFEVLHSDGKYAEEVLGFRDRSERSAKIVKFRGDD